MKYGNVELGQLEALLNKIGGVEGMKQILRGNAKVVFLKHVIDLAGDCMPESWKKDKWTIEKHVDEGQLELDFSKIQLHLSPNQKDGKVIEGNKLRKELESGKVPVLNACILDYLIAHPEIIPDDWKVDENGNTRYIYFWGTVYRDPDGCLHVRYLYWSGGARGTGTTTGSAMLGTTSIPLRYPQVSLSSRALVTCAFGTQTLSPLY